MLRPALILLIATVACRGGSGPEVRVGAVPPPVSPPEGASPRLDPPASPPGRGARDRDRVSGDSLADLAIARAAAERAALTGLEAISLLGDSLRRLPMSAEARGQQQLLLAEAERRWARDSNPDDLIWVGRRLAYLGRYNEALATFGSGVERFPGDPRFLRHRGHRMLTLRQFAQAEADFAEAARMVAGRPDEVEPDGLPNARGIPTSTLQSNIHYHLGLARYVQGDFAGALEAYDDALAVSRNNDMRVATDYWRYLTLRRLGRSAEAAASVEWVTPQVDIIENAAYHRLILFYRGLLPLDELEPEGADALDDATVAYGLGAWELLEGRPEAAMRRFERLLTGGNWPSFGYVAAEAELSRLSRLPSRN